MSEKSRSLAIITTDHASSIILPKNPLAIGFASQEEVDKFKSGFEIDKNPLVLSLAIDPRKDLKFPQNLFRTGVIVQIKDIKNYDSVLLFEGLGRAEVVDFQRKLVGKKHVWVATVKRILDEDHSLFFLEEQGKFLTQVGKLKTALAKIISLLKETRSVEDDAALYNLNLAHNFLNSEEATTVTAEDVDQLVWTLVHFTPGVELMEKQEFIESTSLPERMTLCATLLRRCFIRLHVAQDVARKISDKKDGPKEDSKSRTDSGTESGSDHNDDEDKLFADVHPFIKKAWARFKQIRDHMNEDARVVARDDIENLISYESPQGNSHEWGKTKKRLEFLLSLPWNVETEPESDIDKVKQALEEDHFGLKHVKEKICENIAPKILNPLGKGQIICFAGPPGVGKTSLAKSIARALNRKLIRISVGGIRQESKIRGHDFTFTGSQAGDILQEIKRCGVKNPVFVVDEIDKIGHFAMDGDPASAMLEVFDPEQNNSFKDHYAGCSFDLSKVFFISTANVEDNIIQPLHDRMDTIRIPGYLEPEKTEIARRHLIPRWMTEVGLAQNNIEVNWDDNIISFIIRGYTNEAGVRSLERCIASICSKLAGSYLKSKNEGTPIKVFEINTEIVEKFLGPSKSSKDKARPTGIGEAIGLAWTEVGGSILFIQSVLYPNSVGKKSFARTGMQGDVMKEADEVAMSLTRIFLENVDPDRSKEWRRKGVHLHIPEGAIPKDGPSAGLPTRAALHSLAINKPLRPLLAMTGEIDLMANVLPVGGIREKVVAAERAGIREVMLPKANERNLHDVPEAVKEKLKFHFVDTLDEAIDIAFPKPE